MAGPSGATPRLALPYPITTDTADVPRDVQALATKLDSADAGLIPLLPNLPVGSFPNGHRVVVNMAQGVGEFIFDSALDGWWFLGGFTWHGKNATLDSIKATTANVYGILPNTPSVVAPWPGTYACQIEGWLTGDATALTVRMRPFLDTVATPLVDTDSALTLRAASGDSYQWVQRQRITLAAAGSIVVGVAHTSTTPTVGYQRKSIAVTPEFIPKR